MDRFSEKSKLALGEYYVYGLIDPRTGKLFYIGKGTGDRVFHHERESAGNPDSEKLKLKTIAEIKSCGLDVKKIIINHNLTEQEAFASEAALINAFNYVEGMALTNIVAGHHSAEALTVEDYERIYGSVDLTEDDIKHEIMVIKINRLYERHMDSKKLYGAVRGIWRADLGRAKKVKYVFGVYNALVVAVYHPTNWYRYENAPDGFLSADYAWVTNKERRILFVDNDFESGLSMDAEAAFYYGKNISKLKVNQNAQNPITYLSPKSKIV